jgi:hypothetical protein
MNRGYCNNCVKDMRAVTQTNAVMHIVNILLVIGTAGIWLIPYILILMISGTKYICHECGTELRESEGPVLSRHGPQSEWKRQKTFSQIGSKKSVESEIINMLSNGATPNDIGERFDVTDQSVSSKLAAMRRSGVIS